MAYGFKSAAHGSRTYLLRVLYNIVAKTISKERKTMTESGIYKIRERGQVVTEGCQWIVTHSRLAMQLAVKPVLILAVIELVNIIFLKSILFSLGIAFVALLLIPTVPSMMMYVVEHAEEFDYPKRLPKLFELWRMWISLLHSAIVIGGISVVASFLSSMTIAAPFFIDSIRNMALVIHHRNSENGMMSAIGNAVTLSFSNFVSLMFMILGVSIITMSMIIGPTLLIISFAGILSLYISPALKNLITRILNDSETQISLILECLIVGYVFAGMISIIVTHFFYGHCMMCEEEKKAEKEARKKQKINQQGK